MLNSFNIFMFLNESTYIDVFFCTQQNSVETH